MRRLRHAVLAAASVLHCGLAMAQTTVYVSPHAPTETTGLEFLEPWHVAEYAAGAWVLALDVPGPEQIDAVNAAHKMDRPGNWLFSVGVPSEIGGVPVEPRDVVHFDGLGYSVLLRGAALKEPIPANNGIDALYLDGSDEGDLILSLAAAVELPAGSGTVVEAADLLRFRRTGPGDTDWVLDGIEFDASSVGGGIDGALNLIGADSDGSTTFFVLDNPARLEPSTGPTVFERGQVIAWDGAAFSVAETLVDWPADRRVDALSCQASPGEVVTLELGRSPLATEQVRLSWSASCTSGAEDFGIYEGALGDFASHVMVDCEDDDADRVEDLTPSDGNTYYLVVPHNTSVEGSYGEMRVANVAGQRPPPAKPGQRCREQQQIRPCPGA